MSPPKHRDCLGLNLQHLSAFCLNSLIQNIENRCGPRTSSNNGRRAWEEQSQFAQARPTSSAISPRAAQAGWPPSGKS